jgi:hypothetical protein
MAEDPRHPDSTITHIGIHWRAAPLVENDMQNDATTTHAILVLK